MGAGRRVAVDAASPPWSSVVLVQAPGLTRCTGFVLDGGRVVTAAHCLFSRRLGRFIPAESLHVLAGYAGGDFAAHARVARYRVGDGYDPRDGSGAGADVAVLVLAAPIGVPALAVGSAVPGEAVVLGGYNRDRAQVLIADWGCAVTGRAVDGAGRALLVHGCEATLGTSGAPVLAHGADGVWRAVGVHVASRRAGVGGVAVPAAAIAGVD